MAVNKSTISKPEDKPSEVNWLDQARQRQQALTALHSICQEKVQETFSADTFCQLFLTDV